MASDDDDFFDEEEDEFKEEAEKKASNADSNEEELDETLDPEGDEDGEDDGELGPDEFEGEEGEGPSKKKLKKVPVDENGKFIQIDGTVTPTKRDAKGAVVEICLDAGKLKYPIILDNMGKNLIKMCFNQIFVGAVIRIENGVKSIEVKNYI